MSVVALLSLIMGIATPVALACKEITAKGEGECDAPWHWVINQIDNITHAPETIRVEWPDGVENVPLEKFTGGVAHYSTTSHGASVTPNKVTAVIYDQWSGEFNLSHRPCPQPPVCTSVTKDKDQIIPTGETVQVTVSAVNANEYRIVRTSDNQVMASGSSNVLSFVAMPNVEYQAQVRYDGGNWTNEGCKFSFGKKPTEPGEPPKVQEQTLMDFFLVLFGITPNTKTEGNGTPVDERSYMAPYADELAEIYHPAPIRENIKRWNAPDDIVRHYAIDWTSTVNEDGVVLYKITVEALPEMNATVAQYYDPFHRWDNVPIDKVIVPQVGYNGMILSPYCSASRDDRGPHTVVFPGWGGQTWTRLRSTFELPDWYIDDIDHNRVAECFQLAEILRRYLGQQGAITIDGVFEFAESVDAQNQVTLNLLKTVPDAAEKFLAERGALSFASLVSPDGSTPELSRFLPNGLVLNQFMVSWGRVYPSFYDPETMSLIDSELIYDQFYRPLPPMSHIHDLDRGLENPLVSTAWQQWQSEHGTDPWGWMREIPNLTPLDQFGK